VSVLTVLTSGQQNEPEKENNTKPEKVQLKITTTAPEGIAIPDEVETRLGKLHLRDGFPDKANVEIAFRYRQPLKPTKRFVPLS